MLPGKDKKNIAVGDLTGGHWCGGVRATVRLTASLVDRRLVLYGILPFRSSSLLFSSTSTGFSSAPPCLALPCLALPRLLFCPTAAFRIQSNPIQSNPIQSILSTSMMPTTLGGFDDRPTDHATTL